MHEMLQNELHMVAMLNWSDHDCNSNNLQSPFPFQRYEDYSRQYAGKLLVILVTADDQKIFDKSVTKVNMKSKCIYFHKFLRRKIYLYMLFQIKLYILFYKNKKDK